ncbi:hypothetical protein HHI36_004042 [Cryptolaemus montrouzieri]|uniref:RING-type E3 ubiquitin transferase n=1 Tax=Cryptolaemus montrouzieri TaxID=559131 RepID=A0ABD2NR09_9CUCU
MAPRRGARVVKIDHVVDYDNLTVKEVLCPICRSILIEPVTLPCNHVFCSSCFQGTMENANLVCPLCRVRIGSWLRSCKKENKLINVDYWNAIKKLFPIQIKNKLEGIEENLDYETPVIRLAEPGELKREYETQIQKETETIRKEREAEAKASEELIRKLREQEEYQKVLEEEKLRLDEEIAKKLADELNCAEKHEKFDTTECSQSTSKLKKQSNCVKKVGPLDRFLKAKDSKSATIVSSIKDDQNKKLSFDKKEFTCRILCQDIGNDNSLNLLNKKSKVDINLTNLNVWNKKINTELNRVIEVEGNSDSSDSIDSEYRYFKPVDCRRIPPRQKTTPIKVPTSRVKVVSFKISAPKGQNTLQIKPGISAFARFNNSVHLEEQMEATATVKATQQVQTRHKSLSPEKKSVCMRIKGASPEKKQMDTSLKSASPQKKNNNSLQCALSPKKEFQLTKISKTNSLCKRKVSNTHSDISPNKRSKPEFNNSFGRHLSTPSSPFRGFCATNANKKSPSKSDRRLEQLKLSQKTAQNARKFKNQLQEKADYELAKKLQIQFDSISYSTRSSTQRRGIKVTRQATLDNMLSKKS